MEPVSNLTTLKVQLPIRRKGRSGKLEPWSVLVYLFVKVSIVKTAKKRSLNFTIEIKIAI